MYFSHDSDSLKDCIWYFVCLYVKLESARRWLRATSLFHVRFRMKKYAPKIPIMPYFIGVYSFCETQCANKIHNGACLINKRCFIINFLRRRCLRSVYYWNGAGFNRQLINVNMRSIMVYEERLIKLTLNKDGSVWFLPKRFRKITKYLTYFMWKN